jgi:aminoglycoside/choline kinase family phosphotransferase
MKEEEYKKLHKKHFGSDSHTFELITPHGSSREYTRIHSDSIEKVIGTYGENEKENIAFIKLSKHLKDKGVPAPSVFIHSDDYLTYLQEDLGGEDLFSLIKNSTDEKGIEELLKKSIDLLVKFQWEGGVGWDYKDSYPFPAFDESEIDKDVARFKEKFLNTLQIDYSEKEFQKEINTLKNLVLEIPESLYQLIHRDFQPRNILIKNDILYVIDFQSARKGPVHYDIASLLFESKIKYPKEIRENVLNYYIQKAEIKGQELFLKHFYVLALFRTIHALGVYGMLGLEQKKQFFLESILPTLSNLEEILKILEVDFNIHLKEIKKISTITQ